jgi:hypothetical protein
MVLAAFVHSRDLCIVFAMGRRHSRRCLPWRHPDLISGSSGAIGSLCAHMTRCFQSGVRSVVTSVISSVYVSNLYAHIVNNVLEVKGIYHRDSVNHVRAY